MVGTEMLSRKYQRCSARAATAAIQNDVVHTNTECGVDVFLDVLG